MFTTLSTVGLGDYNPKSEIERLVICIILMIGVSSFAYIMSVFTTIVQDMQIATAAREESQSLSRWFLILKHFNKNRPLPPEMINYFEKYFEYFWRHDKSNVVCDGGNMTLMKELPSDIQSRIYKDFLFEDFLE